MRGRTGTLALGFVLAAAAGCVEPADLELPGLGQGLVLPEMCGRLGPAHCRDDGVGLVVQDLRLAADPGWDAGPGVRVRGLATDLTLRNVTVAGFAVGVALGATECHACRVTLEQVRLSGPSTPDSVGLTDVADGSATAVPPDLRVVGLEAQGHAVAVALLPPPWLPWRSSLAIEGLDVECLVDGLRASAHQLVVADARVVGCTAEALDLTSGGTGVLRGGAGRGSGHGAMLQGAWKVVGFEASGNRVGVQHMGAGLDAEGLTLVDNSVVGLWTVGGTTLHGSTIAGNLEGVVAPPWAVATGFDATGNWWGAPTGPTPARPLQQVPGAGDSYSGHVQAVPFLLAPP